MPELNREDWDSFIQSQNGSFLQSWAWGQFQKSTGKKVLFLKKNDWQSLVIIFPLLFGKTYFYAPYGPVWNNQKTGKKIIFDNFLNKLKSIAKEHNAIFLKIEPKTADYKIAETIQNLGFKKSEKSTQPEDSLIIDLKKPEEEIIESFEKRCQREIKLAEKKNAAIFCDNSENGVKNFLTLLGKTAKRDSFRAHPLSYYQMLIKTLEPAGRVDLFFAKIGQDIISGCMIIYFGPAASYVHAASAGPYRAANALVWAAIKEAKKKQCQWFDMYGVASADAGENHPWRGLTKFKESFGGKRIHYIGAFDYVFSSFWYKIYKLYKNYK